MIFFSYILNVNAELKIDITSGYTEPTPIGIYEFIGTNDEEKILAKQITKLVIADLNNSGLFKIIDPIAGDCFHLKIGIGMYVFWGRVN